MQVKTFKYLDNLIHNGQTEIVLSCDINLDSNEETEFMQGINVNIDNLVIDGNGHTINAMGKTRIFNVSCKNLTIKNISLINGYTHDNDSGAIIFAQEDSSLNIANVRFINGHSANNAGAIFNFGDLITIESSEFKNNACENNGGAIFISEGMLIIKNTKFNNNSSKVTGGAIANFSELNIKDSEFINNHGVTTGAISNSRNTKISDTIFCNNKSNKDGGAIVNLGSMTVTNSKFKCNTSKTGNAIYHTGDSFKLEDNQFYESENESIYYLDNFPVEQNSCVFNVELDDICPNSKSTITEKIGSNHIQSNSKPISTKENNSKVDDFLKNLEMKYFDLDVKTYQKHMSKLKQGTFKYLDTLIHNNSNEIILTSDITLDSINESVEYKDGINIEMDNIVIDGNNHTIDAKGKTRIFNITGENITIKNIIFKNAFVKMPGGAITNYSKVEISNCSFIENICKSNGGAIYNFGEMTIDNSYFYKNSASNAGSILNWGKLNLNNSKFCKNNSKQMGGAIVNEGQLELNNSEFHDNETRNYGGAIFNGKYSNLKSVNTEFKRNNANIGGDSIYNRFEN